MVGHLKKKKKHSVQRIKLNFLCNIWVWSNLFITLGPSSIADFVDWIRSYQGVSFLLSLFDFFDGILGVRCILLVYFGTLFGVFLINICSCYLSKKKPSHFKKAPLFFFLIDKAI